MAPFVEDSFISTLFDPAATAMPSDASGSNLLLNAPCSALRTNLTSSLASTSSANLAAPLSAFDQWIDLPNDVVESLKTYFSDDEALSSFSTSPATSPDSTAAAGSIFDDPATLYTTWWANPSSALVFDNSADNFGVVPTSAFAMAHAQPLPSRVLQVPQQQHVSSPPLPLSPMLDNVTPVMSADVDAACSADDLPVVEPLRGKRVSFKRTPDAEPEILSNKEFYARIREPELCSVLLRKSHPVFTSLDDAVGSFYILKDVRARKPPLIDAEKFNCHTRRDAGDAHWQYNVPNTDFTCRVTQWDSQSRFETATYTSYHYYRSPTPRRTVGSSRYSPY